jgi:hypothetical protein
MRLIASYLDSASRFERFATEGSTPALKETQAAAYRKLASERAKKLGLPEPAGSIDRLS